MADSLCGVLYACAPGANSGAPNGGRTLGTPFSGFDVEDGGAYAVFGTVGIDSTPDIPVHRKVRLLCYRSGRLVREMWSDPITGSYRFDHLRIGPWTVMSHDYTGNYNAVVADNILGDLE